jgi:hypothetical protein
MGSSRKGICKVTNDLEQRVAKLEAALSRQADNMAFVLNNASLPDQWYEKFLNELALDRVAIGDVS